MAALPKIIAIVGPTGSGKTNTGILVATKKHGAVLSADSRQVYTGMDIGTAKPEAVHHHGLHPMAEPELIESVPHYFFNIRQPNQPYDLASWQQDAFQVIDTLLAQHTVPLLVGGTMLYLDSIAFNYSIPSVPPNAVFREEMEKEDVGKLYERLLREDPRAATFVQAGNKRRIIRALEVIAMTGQPFSAQRLQHEPKYEVIWQGLFPGWEQMKSNITQRVTDMITAGLVDETRQLQQHYGADLPLLQTMNYQQAAAVIAGTLPETALADTMIRINLRYAHRQMSWWRSNSAITWYSSPQDLIDSHVRSDKIEIAENPMIEAAQTHRTIGPTPSRTGRASGVT